MIEHQQILEEIHLALIIAGRPNVPTIAGLGQSEEVAMNSSEMKITSASGKSYTLSVIEDE